MPAGTEAVSVAASGAGVTVRVNVHVPVSPRPSTSVPVAWYMPVPSGLAEATAPDDETEICGLPEVWV